jgi:hypothetical protein
MGAGMAANLTKAGEGVSPPFTRDRARVELFPQHSGRQRPAIVETVLLSVAGEADVLVIDL